MGFSKRWEGALLGAERARNVSFVAVFVFFKAALDVALHLSAVRVRVIAIISTILADYRVRSWTHPS